jgi:hypothetical protein
MSVVENIEVHELAWHRNGISGEGFFAVTFTADADGEQTKFVATVFPPGDGTSEPDWGAYERGDWDNPRVAVLALDKLPSVEFGVNSWRGDNYAPALYRAILAYNRELDARLIGGGS